MALSTLLLGYLCIVVQVKAWTVTSYYKTYVTTTPNQIFTSVIETTTVTVPVFPTAAVSTLSASTITDGDPFGNPYLTVIEVFVPSDAPATTTTTAPFACDSNGVNTCTDTTTIPVETEYIAYMTITAPSYCSNTFSFVEPVSLDKIYQVPSEVTSQVLASATYRTTYEISSVTYVDVYVPTDMYTATVANAVSALVSQCIDPRADAENDGIPGMTTLTCTPGPDGPTQGCPVPTPSAAASSTIPPLIDTSAIFSAISSAEASATGGKKNDAARNVGGGKHWAPTGWSSVCAIHDRGFLDLNAGVLGRQSLPKEGGWAGYFGTLGV